MSSTVQGTCISGIAIADILGGAGRAIGYILIALGHLPRAGRAVAEYEALAALDDDRLAERGLARDEIARHVFLHHFPDV